MNNQALKQVGEGENNYALKPDHSSVWVTVEHVSVYIHRTSSGAVHVKLCALGLEDDETLDLAECIADQAEAIELINTIKERE